MHAHHMVSVRRDADLGARDDTGEMHSVPASLVHCRKRECGGDILELGAKQWCRFGVDLGAASFILAQRGTDHGVGMDSEEIAKEAPRDISQIQ